METLLTILLYLSLIVSGGTYYSSDIDALERDHRTAIDNVRKDPEQMKVATGCYEPLVSTIIIRVNPHQE